MKYMCCLRIIVVFSSGKLFGNRALVSTASQNNILDKFMKLSKVGILLKTEMADFLSVNPRYCENCICERKTGQYLCNQIRAFKWFSTW